MSSNNIKNVKELVNSLWKWTVDRLERTTIVVFKFTVPKQYVSPFGYLGTLTAIVFAILGVSGAFLMFYYRPDVELAFLSVQEIQEKVPFGYIMRNIHYHASNLMVLLAVLHLYYQYFSGRYKIKNEVLWVTGVILGVLTVLEAYTGYNLIMNQRALLAVNIGMGLTYSAPLLGPTIAPIFLGGGLFDLIIRFYALHVFILPLIMLLLAVVHFPRALVIDFPIISAVVGVIFISAGLFPAELGIRFDLTRGVVEVPEWYLTAIYAFLRAGTERFTAGALLPLLFVILFLIVPFVDRSKKLSWRDRPFFTALGVASIALVAITTVWGFYVDFSKETAFDQLYIEPTLFYGLIGGVTLSSFYVTYFYLSRQKRGQRPPPTRPIVLSSRASAVLMTTLLILVAGAVAGTFYTYSINLPNHSMFYLGVAFILFGLLLHIYRHTISVEERQKGAK
ncbi:MAG: cytochrome b N-terminal domain-containing protein [Nitrososphaerota archaeon]|nr:cytochrome b N-terminal domain-containing protein [Candidatus Calditenuaceae archaeon]MDW8073011.1 cytochrome b N-terminal domain-containing protein [Nitrososphaerota archaeon]